MAYEPRTITFLGLDGRLKHYGIARHDRAPRPALVDATARVARAAIHDGAFGFTIAHDARSAALGLVYWWAAENELHHRVFAAPPDDPGALEPADGTAMACVWELEVIDFERRAWLEHVLVDDDLDAYLSATPAEVAV
jgi:hypothetical protein